MTTNHAPRPPKSGMTRSLYDAVSALGGKAMLSEVIQYLPATDDASRWSKARPDYVRRRLQSSVYHGYLVAGTDEQGHAYWKVAPLSYYEQRAAELKAQTGTTRRRRKLSDKRVSIVYQRDTRYEWMAFALGVLAGAAVTALIALSVTP